MRNMHGKGKMNKKKRFRLRENIAEEFLTNAIKWAKIFLLLCFFNFVRTKNPVYLVVDSLMFSSRTHKHFLRRNF